MTSNYKKLIDILGKDRVLLNESLSKYTSFHLGGPSDLFFKAKTQDDLLKAVSLSRKLKIPYFILGGGTNLLVSDRGFRGIVIRNETSAIKLAGIRGGNKGKTHTVFIEAESGVSVNRLVRFTLDQGLSGLQGFLGQPGTVGGAVWINAHNIKMVKFFSDVVFSAKLLKVSGEVKEVSKNYFKFYYDKSIIQESGEIVLSVIFKLERGEKQTLWQYAQKVLTHRQKSQPQGVFSAGCIFKNISKSVAFKLATPNYTCSSGFLLDSVGLKGAKIGGAWFSTDHANFITHRGKAKSSDMLELINLAKKKVKKRYNIEIEEEIKIVGDF